MAYQLKSPMQTFFGATGQILAGGSLKFFAADTVTPKAVYADKALTITNGSTVALDASGRPNVACWGTGDYYIEVYDSANVKQGQDTATDPAGAALNIPIPNTGEFLTGDGAQILKQLIKLIPDPTGFSGKFLGTDGTAITWQSGPAAPVIPSLPSQGVVLDYAKKTIQIGNYLIQCGNDTAPASGTVTATKSVTFPTAMVSCIFCTAIATSAQAGGPVVVWENGRASGTSATFVFDVAEGYAGGSNMTSPTTFDWIAIGSMV